MVEVLDAPFESDFIGVVQERDRERSSVARRIRGTVRIEPANTGGSRSITGTFQGTFDGGDPAEFELGGDIRLGRKIFGSPRRDFSCSVMDPQNPRHALASVQGSVSRNFFDWYQVPRDNIELDRLHGQLSREFDLASVFTWIAGLLNVMAIWDAVEGPAYGYGDEKPDEEDSGKVKKGKSKSDDPTDGQ